jgi:DsbC/DsbD-like thiol-disulfide interchange protein
MVSRARIFVLLAALLAPLLIAPAASAIESSWVEAANSKVRLLAGGAADKEFLRAGIEIQLKSGWHTYWRYAGDAGIPPHFDWSGSKNIAAVEILWPAPTRIRVEDGIESIGYYDSVALPLRVRPQDPTKPVALLLNLKFGVCEKICIPASAKVALEIPSGSSAPSLVLKAAEARVPVKAKLGAAGALRVLGGKFEPGKAPQILVDVAGPPGVPLDLFAEGPTEAWALPLPKRVEANDGRTRFVVPIDGAPTGGSPIPRNLRLTLVAGPAAIEVMVPLD